MEKNIPLHRPGESTQLPRSIGRSCSRTRQRSRGAAGCADRAGSNGSLCKGLDSRYESTGDSGGSTSTVSQSATVHRHREGHIFGGVPESLNRGYFCILYTHLPKIRCCGSDIMGGRISYGPPHRSLPCW